jgi:electron transport complex protein RnfC
MQNVGTAYAVKRAVIDGEPLTERVVTLTGEAVSRPGNVWARLGTPVRHLLEMPVLPERRPDGDHGRPADGLYPAVAGCAGGENHQLPARAFGERNGREQEEKGCIRCSACADACPADLLPQQLYWFSKGQQHDKATAHNLADCIECGACAWVCPSNIPLVQYFRQEKAEIYAISMEEKRAAEAKRFEARQARLEREKSPVRSAINRPPFSPARKIRMRLTPHWPAFARKKRCGAAVVIPAGEKPDNSEAIAAREARKARLAPSGRKSANGRR